MFKQNKWTRLSTNAIMKYGYKLTKSAEKAYSIKGVVLNKYVVNKAEVPGIGKIEYIEPTVFEQQDYLLKQLIVINAKSK